MEQRFEVALFLLVIVLTGLFVGYYKAEVLERSHERLGGLQQDLEREREFSRLLLEDNEGLREANSGMRERLLELEANLSSREEAIRACIASVPDLVVPESPPVQRVNVSDLLVGKNAVVLNIGEVITGVISESPSMLPLLAQNDIVLEKIPEGPEDIFLGDIIIYERDGQRIIHRVVGIGEDAEGWYSVTKGDNNPAPDPWRIRFEDVRGVVVSILY